MKEPHDTLSVPRTVAAMLVAPFGAVGAFVAWGAGRGEVSTQSPLVVLGFVGAYAGLSGLVLVFPFLLVFPSLRRPPTGLP